MVQGVNYAYELAKGKKHMNTINRLGIKAGLLLCAAIFFSCVVGYAQTIKKDAESSDGTSTDVTEFCKLTAGFTAQGDYFGGSVSVDGDTAIIGAPAGDESGEDFGCAYIFSCSNGVWMKKTTLFPSDTTKWHDSFGGSVSISGDTVIVGASHDYDRNSIDSGSAYVFKSIGGIWTQETKLTASDKSGDDFFGSSVSISGDTAVVGATGDYTGYNHGSVYVYTRKGGVWTEQTKLTANDLGEHNTFGLSTSISDDTIVVGTITNDVDALIPGVAYVFIRANGGWLQQAKLVAQDITVGDGFGWSVSVDNNTAIIGAPGADPLGSVFVFTRSGREWTQEAKLTVGDSTPPSPYLGQRVSVSGNTAVVAANYFGLHSGSAYVFSRKDKSWTQGKKLIAKDGTEGVRYGFDVSVSGNTSIVGAPKVNFGSEVNHSAAYVFDLAKPKS